MACNTLLLLCLHISLFVRFVSSTTPVDGKSGLKTMPPQQDRSDESSLFQKLQDVIGSDVGDRGMKSLIVPGDLHQSCLKLAALPKNSNVVVLSGFPCCVTHDPPTETDGPPGAAAIVRALLQLQHRVTLVTDECNRAVFEASLKRNNAQMTGVDIQCFPSEQDWTKEKENELQSLIQTCNAIVACERAGPAADGHCYTMRGIDMTERNLVAPLERIVTETRSRGVLFVAIGDGGNEMGMGKVLQCILENPKIQNASRIASVVAADYLIAASVSNWGGYALAAGVAYIAAQGEYTTSTLEDKTLSHFVKEWIGVCVPTRQEEVDLLDRCVDKGCRDGVSGKQEATVDGMPLETSLQCLDDVRRAVISFASQHEDSHESSS